MVLADELAKKQRSISVAEFFEKNKHMLGFDSPTRGIITTIKEAIDNSLDACEEAEVLPDILVSVRKLGGDVFRVVVEDNGPGIIPEKMPAVFAKLLYGSRFHQVRQTRGQQGIGISAAVLYAQLTTGKPTTVISRTGAKTKAHKMTLVIKTETNEPEVLSHEEIDWVLPHGTRIELEFKSTMQAKKKLLEYLKYTSVVNPHARFRVEIDDESFTFDRVSNDVPPCPVAIKPHPYGIELGVLKRMTAASDLPLKEFLIESFSKVGEKTALEICSVAKLDAKVRVNTIQLEQLNPLLDAMQTVKIPAPPASQCLSPITEDLIVKGMEKEFQLDFIKARTRPGNVFGGNSFIVEAAIGYGGKLPSEGSAMILRFANRVPLLYQQGACAITSAIANVNWKNYGVSQQGLPMGPILILVHVAATNVPFTSESKDAVASVPEVEREITLALQELGRDLKLFLSRRDKNKLQDDRARAICAVIPLIARKVGEIVELPPPDTSLIEGRIMRRVVLKKGSANGRITIRIDNYTTKDQLVSLYDISGDSAADATVPPDFVTEMEGEYTKVWKRTLSAGANFEVSYTGTGGGIVDMQGVAENLKVVVDVDV
ncbi:MAG: DNA topoisomerase VI subunit B [Methanocorpusculum sp.]|uniref:Type 2 DNA topoisomerase 6 subunit B n=1 Tax=Methanocorpusculum petauri TaxID=3002863 RepID=A0ABT4IEY5_9EURY|nr:DNA topoisomerase VI subunit B [Methanocorpusculum petauri]MCZ9312445.1 DNA topoisomerase VI subunit B [Methanocorpusculum sp.]MCZ0859725.1 DNA topoisomerase VI subunit B [Methanocorpusculum petauri]MDE2444377.1 DNA topoisomerase VI subunit B [Methanocorpusculum sp.]MDE2523229.1 DNA topoisomerase VI subunit B [Methanocorpusculum sp.]MDE2523963.1 DNA topoisomerase VI subunit B [Methanocorpusculum sp.]